MATDSGEFAEIYGSFDGAPSPATGADSASHAAASRRVPMATIRTINANPAPSGDGPGRHTAPTSWDALRVRMLESVLDVTTDVPVLGVAPDGSVAACNADAARLFETSRARLEGTDLRALLTPGAGAPLPLGDIHDALAGMAGRQRSERWDIHRPDGSAVSVAVAVTAVDIGTSEPAYLVSLESGPPQRVRMGDDAQQMFRMAPVAMCLVGIHGEERGRFLDVNAEMCALLGRPEHELIGRPVKNAGPESPTGLIDRILSGEVDRWESEKEMLRADGTSFWASITSTPMRGRDGRPEFVVAQIQDITARRVAEQRLEYDALHDSLTGLANRTLLLDHIERALTRGMRAGTYTGVLYIDLDDFKVVNESLGHDAGDEYLLQIANRITAALRDVDLAARLGGDEFAVLCQDLSNPAEIELVAERLGFCFQPAVRIRGTVVRPSASIGVAVSPLGACNASLLLSEADAAMFEAKSNGKGRYEIANAPLRARALRTLRIEAELHQAIERSELRLHYQPMIDLRTGAITAVEALLRWQHPEQGLLGPADFLDIAEQRGIIRTIGDWVLRQACEDTARWSRAAGEAPPEVWVNVSTRQLGRHHLGTVVAGALAAGGLAPELLCIELTERELVSAAHSVCADLRALPEMGVRVAIDDFGTGHAGFEYLRDFTVGALKVDRSFVAGLGVDRTNTALTGSIIALGKELDLLLVGEGVETPLQLDALRALGCDRAQGFLLAKPVPASTIDVLLRDAGPTLLDQVRTPAASSSGGGGA